MGAFPCNVPACGVTVSQYNMQPNVPSTWPVGMLTFSLHGTHFYFKSTHILLAAVTPVTRLKAVLQDLSWGTSAMKYVSEAFSHR